MRKLTTQEFIDRACAVHGDKYGYELVRYIVGSKPVKIICYEHGEFEQRPDSHLVGKGCALCCGNVKLDTQQFIDRARAVHGDRYGYAFSVYQSTHNKVMIHCPEHGMFSQTPHSHISGKSGCPSCQLLDTKKFVEKANIIHGNKYEYDLIRCVKSSEKVSVRCKKHGVFTLLPHAHLKGGGCVHCVRLDREKFITRSMSVHGDKYDYSDTHFINSYSNVKIKCKKHGVFEQNPSSHMRGHGCSSCQCLTTEDVILRSRETHGDKYCYDFVVYNSDKEKILIKCEEHGLFYQSPFNHINGSGCPGCANYGFDRTKTGFLYVLRSDCGHYMKIGITNKPNRRQVELKCRTPFSFKRIELIEGPGEQIANLEKELLAEYQPAEFTETFDGYSEWRLWDDSIRHKLLTSKIQG